MGIIKKFRALRLEQEEIRTEMLNLSKKVDALSGDISANRASTLSIIDSLNALGKKDWKKRNKLTVFFLISNVSSIDTIKGLIKTLTNDERFQVFVGSIHSRMLPNPNFENEPMTHQKLVEEGIEHIRMPYDYSGLTLLKQLNPDVIVRQTHWDADLQEHFSTRYLNFTRTVIIDYALGSLIDPPPLNPEFPLETINDTAHRLAWRVFHAQISEISETLKKNYLPNFHNQINVGSPKTQELLKAEKKWFRSTENKKIYWSFHHTIGDEWTKFGLFPKIYQDFLKLAADHPDFDFVFGEHPALQQRITGDDVKLNLEEFNDWLVKWNELPNTFHIPGSPDYIQYMKAADIVVTDGLSPLIEAQILEIPLIFLERRGHSSFNSLGKKISTGWHTIPESKNSVENVFSEIQEILQNGDSLKSFQIENREIWTKYVDPIQVIIDDFATLIE